MAPGQEASLELPCSNLRSFRSKCTELKKVLVTLLVLFGAPIAIRRLGNCAPLAPHRYAPDCDVRRIFLLKLFTQKS